MVVSLTGHISEETGDDAGVRRTLLHDGIYDAHVVYGDGSWHRHRRCVDNCNPEMMLTFLITR